MAQRAEAHQAYKATLRSLEMYQHVRVAVKMKPKAFGMYDSIYAEIQKLQYDSNAVYIKLLYIIRNLLFTYLYCQ
ncbi:hypothetical protein BC938DRAFT_483295 [Jimgerdemannia flammicorona]|uniref:Uncharacterized protein n=1 Tax=Jimgerdemannia flammicorona TaxID=994334 RepID=A0A433QVQ1_9FUNG|nr:hypothetical protein BC938DRAFT_483295 [Jimgerdemannia flammicorona]